MVNNLIADIIFLCFKMSVPSCSTSKDDDGPEEGEIEDDEDDIVPLVNSSVDCPLPCRTTSPSLDIFASPRSKESIERDIREFELQKARASRTRLIQGASKSSRGNDIFRWKDLRSRTGFTHGKENRHIHRSQSPLSKSKHRISNDHHNSERYRDISPLRRYSSQSSLDGEEKVSPDHCSHQRVRQKRFKTGRGKRSSSSPDPEHVPSKRNSHHSGKCPLMKALHSVAKGTRLIGTETTESNSTGNSLKKRLFNMGAIPTGDSISSPCVEKPCSFDSSRNSVVISDPESDLGVVDGRSNSTLESSNIPQDVGSESAQTSDTCDDVTIISHDIKTQPEVVTLTDSDDNSTGAQTPPAKSCMTCVCRQVTLDQSTSKRDSILERTETSVSTLPSQSTALESPNNLISFASSIEGCAAADEDDDDDIGQLRLLALQSKKHEHTPPGDDDVLQLRLAALKTAIVKKFKGRKKMKPCSKGNSRDEKPLSPLDGIPLPASPEPADEVTTPVDMDLAETDEELEESDPIKLPSPEILLEDLLPPPPPLDLPLEMYYPDQSVDNSMSNISLFPVPAAGDLVPPPFPHFFQEMLTNIPDAPTASPVLLSTTEAVNISTDLITSTGCDVSRPITGLVDTIVQSSYVNRNENEQAMCFGISSAIKMRLQSKTRPNLLEIPISTKSDWSSSKALIQADNPAPSESMDIESMIVLDEIYDSSPINDRPSPLMDDVENLEIFEHKKIVEGSILLDQLLTREPKSIESQDVDSVKAVLRHISLDEEEQALRQRLLLNLANKQRIAVSRISPVNPSSSNNGELLSKNGMESHSDSDKSVNHLNSVKPLNESLTEYPSKQKQTNCAQKSLSDDKRLIINLDEDSDSSVDYSKAEALGMKCVKNQEAWFALVKEFENSAKANVSKKRATKSVSKLPPSITKPSMKSNSRTKAQEKIPPPENTSDLESSVERFLKGVRSSHDARVSQSASNLTPVAVRHLPISRQEEYRRLKEQLAELEKQKVNLNKKSTLILSKVLEPSEKNISEMTSKFRSISKTFVNPMALSSKSVVPGNTVNPPQSCTLSKQINLIKPRPVQGLSAKQKFIESERSLRSLTGTHDHLPVISAIGLGPPKLQPKTHKLSKDSKQMPQPVLKGLTNVVKIGKVSMPPCNATMTSKSHSLTGRETQSLHSGTINSVLLSKQPNNTKTVVEQNDNGILNGLETKMGLERSIVLVELAALAKLLSQVDKSLEAQSRSANEVESLLEKLCLAAGRWRAQSHTVTNLVVKVAQRQKELSLVHRRCVAASKSCADMGNRLHGKTYRIPSDPAGAAMPAQLKQVHQKTQVLAKRRAVEQERKALLETKAEECLSKFFGDSKKPLPARIPPPKKPQNLHPGKDCGIHADETISSSSLSSNNVNSESTHTDATVIQGSSNVITENNSACSSSLENAAHGAMNASSALVSRLLAYRIAQGKVRSARALHTSSAYRGSLKKVKRRRIKVKSRKSYRCERKTGNEGQDLSDMDISMDGEENEINEKFEDKNNEVIDMAVSPTASLSPISMSSVPLCSPNSAMEKAFAPSSLVTSELSPLRSSFSLDTFNQGPSLDVNSKVEVRSEEGCDTANAGASNANVPCRKENLSDEVIKPDPRMFRLLRPVLRDYVSPLGGLKILSHINVNESKGEDPYAILCPYDLNGKCQDSDCPFKHQQR